MGLSASCTGASPGTPVVLVGHSMGGRAALGAAGAPNVVAVCALAPWLDGSDPVDQLAGRTVLIAHGDRERYTDPGESYAYALRAKAVTGAGGAVRRARRRPLHDHAAADWHRSWCSGSCSACSGIEPIGPGDHERPARNPPPRGWRSRWPPPTDPERTE